MNRIVKTGIAAVSAAGALAMMATPVMAQHTRGGGAHVSGARSSVRSGGSYRGGGAYRGGYRGGYYRGGGWGGWGLGLGWWPGYYAYDYPYYGGCTVWSPYYGRYVVRPGCYDYGYYPY